MKLLRIRMAALATVVMVATASVWAATGGSPPPPQLVANLLDPAGHPAGTAGYGQQTDNSGKITASFLNVQAGPLNKSLIGSSVNVAVDNGPPIAVKVVADKGGNGSLALNLNSANGNKVPLVKVGSMLTVSPPGQKPIAQGKFAPGK